MAGRLWVVVLVLLAVWCGPAGAQTEIPEELQELRSELFKLFSEGDGQGAVATAQDALATAKRGLEPHLRAEVGEWLAEFAILHARRGELAEAAPCVKGAVAIMEGAYGADQPVFADFLLRLAGRYAAPLNKARGDADPLVARALAVYEQALAPMTADCAGCSSITLTHITPAATGTPRRCRCTRNPSPCSRRPRIRSPFPR
jgi:hypothetical protein